MNAARRVLLVDDDADFVDRHRGVLQENGYDVIAAYGGDECREKAASASPDIVVVDVSSPIFPTILEIMMATPQDRVFGVVDVRREGTSEELLESLMLAPSTSSQTKPAKAYEVRGGQIMGAAKKKVMLVDDDADFVDMHKAVLEKNGYAVTVAYNGAECVQKTQQEKPDLIVLDVMMTTHSEGFNVSRDLRNSERTKNIPILMVTSINETVPYKFEPDETWLPVDSFVEKPIEPEELLEKVGTMLRS
jgi:two-component system alkaline phosphatase synthesis response regulator PhoP